MGRERERERERVQGSLMINTTAFLLFQWSTPKETFTCFAAAASASAVAAVAICFAGSDRPFHVIAHCLISELTDSGITPIIFKFFLLLFSSILAQI